MGQRIRNEMSNHRDVPAILEFTLELLPLVETNDFPFLAQDLFPMNPGVRT